MLDHPERRRNPSVAPLEGSLAERDAAQTAHASILAAQPAPVSYKCTHAVVALLVAVADDASRGGGRRVAGVAEVTSRILFVLGIILLIVGAIKVAYDIWAR